MASAHNNDQKPGLTYSGTKIYKIPKSNRTGQLVSHP